MLGLFFNSEKLPERKLPKPDCKHLNSSVSGLNTLGYATCHDCDAEARLDIVFNNWLEELKMLKRDLTCY